MTKRLLVPLLTVLIGACIDGSGGPAVQDALHASIASEEKSPGDPISTGGANQGAEGEDVASENRPPKTEAEDSDYYIPEFPIHLSIEPGCGFVGQRMRAVVRTEPEVLLSVTVFYADYGMYGTHGGGIASDGGFIFEWHIPTSAPSGSATVDVIGTREGSEGTEVGRAEADFIVAEVGKCP